jgi:ABC-type transport system involved in multi-copper enzyme maturation permease subunit
VNSTIARALLKDAFYQVLDNKVFRMLVIVAMCLILPTFLVGARDDGIHVLFGWKTFTYDEVFSAFGAPLPRVHNLNVAFIQGAQTVVVQGLAGSVGILFCIAATAFFIPRMLEKGAADLLFSKPVSRVVLLVARYASGLLFVAVLAFVLVLGMHVGFLVASGYSDPGFLWSALTLVYTFALIHSFSTLIAVFTRSSVAAILSTLIFFTFNACIQGVWVNKEHGASVQREQRDAEDGEKLEPHEPHPIVSFLIGTLDVLHWTLPKTHDADVLTKKLRTIVAGREFAVVDPVGKLTVADDPPGFVRETPGQDVDLEKQPVAWIAKKDGADVERITLARRSRIIERGDAKSRTKQTVGAAVGEYLDSLKNKAGIEGKPDRTRERVNDLPREIVRWTESTPQGKVSREHVFIPLDDWLFEVDATLRTDSRAARDDAVPRFLGGVKSVHDTAASMETGPWYESRFGWTAPFRYNAFVSLATSFAFLIAMLALASWRLSRIDF